jgi:hypothetical protein
VLLLAYRLFAKGFDYRPPREIRLDNVFIALGEASGGAGFHIGVSDRKPRVYAGLVHHLRHFAARFAQVIVGLLVCGVAHCQERPFALCPSPSSSWGPEPPTESVTDSPPSEVLRR